ncbi:uncharacterized protein [Venturia canescens]|uniref:uncharacterized protein isoform X2 n=1 Tax=Venturia canescens TaxID=32260 RepID=UPI001C9CDFA8|nr:uncharacterized protein LOC122409376 isoform X2 [Venturia canescens]
MFNRKRRNVESTTHQDLMAWHEFGLQSFYGPWGVIARKPNGDLVGYSDYGSPIPPDFHPISPTGNELSSQEQPDPRPSEMLAAPLSLLDFSRFDSPGNATDEEDGSTESPTSGDLSTRKARDTLELVGIVGVIENVEDVSGSEERSNEVSEQSTLADSSTDPNS